MCAIQWQKVGHHCCKTQPQTAGKGGRAAGIGKQAMANRLTGLTTVDKGLASAFVGRGSHGALSECD